MVQLAAHRTLNPAIEVRTLAGQSARTQSVPLYRSLVPLLQVRAGTVGPGRGEIELSVDLALEHRLAPHRVPGLVDEGVGGAVRRRLQLPRVERGVSVDLEVREVAVGVVFPARDDLVGPVVAKITGESGDLIGVVPRLSEPFVDGAVLRFEDELAVVDRWTLSLNIFDSERAERADEKDTHRRCDGRDRFTRG